MLGNAHLEHQEHPAKDDVAYELGLKLLMLALDGQERTKVAVPPLKFPTTRLGTPCDDG